MNINRFVDIYIYCFAISILFIILPIYFGFPKYDNGLYYYIDHGTVTYISKFKYLIAISSQVLCAVGVIGFTASFWLIQKQLGYKPTIIPVLVDPGFVREFYTKIKNNFFMLTIFLVDLLFFVICVFF